MIQLLRALAEDDKVLALLVLVALDFVLGVSAAFVSKTFRLAFIADFLRNDVLSKLVPYFALWAASHVGGDIEIPGLDVELIEDGAFGVIALALAGSVLGSLRVLGVLRAPDALAGGERPPAP